MLAATTKNKEALEKGEGKTGTQLNLSALARLVKGESTEWREGDDIVSIGYLEIINSWLITGVMLADELDGDGNISVGDVGEASLTAAAQSVLDMPVMQQLNDMVNGFKYSEADSLGGKAVDAATSYAASQSSSLVPNFFGGIAQTVDKKRSEKSIRRRQPRTASPLQRNVKNPWSKG